MGTSRTVVHYASGDNRDYEFEWSKAVLEYLEKGYPAEEKNCELEVGSTTYKVLKRDTVTAFYDADGNTLFDVTNDRLKKTKAIEALSKMHIEHQKLDGGNKGNDVVRMWAEKVLQNRRDSDG